MGYGIAPAITIWNPPGLKENEATSKLEKAVKIDSRKYEALWHLGKAHSAEAFLASDPVEAQSNFEKADMITKICHVYKYFSHLHFSIISDFL
ncbi:hypothetical protein RND71_023233 [Anisodus tanguticus]|uniref:Uncharacterized protein n=1 Tax=Anisodus tanguticus TaxID=243964 RepID=A0AAE1V5V9_9SOLA|nr:hypothetical protein RND71_023233 [Anisodus tanguticus]